MAQQQQPRESGRSFSDVALETLVMAVESRRGLLFPQGSRKPPKATSRRLWQDITTDVTANGVVPRIWIQGRKKFHVLMRPVKAKVDHIRREQQQTGGSQAALQALSQLEELVLDIIEGMGAALSTPHIMQWFAINSLHRRELIRAHRNRNVVARRLMGRRPYPRRQYRTRRSYLDMSEADCVKRLHFRREVVTEICDMVRADLQPRSRRTTALSVEVKVTAALSFYASGSFQATTGDVCAISQRAIHTCIYQVTAALYARRNDFINFPMTAQAIHERAMGFFRIAGFPKVQGCIDCTHVALRAPVEDSEQYRNRKGFHSINVQLVCDDKQRIMSVDARYPGSTHDAFILRDSILSDMFEQQPEGQSWLLGDKGYGQTTWLMTPLRVTRTETDRQYNMAHIATHSIIESAIGILKQRFRCLDHSGGQLQYSPEMVGHFTVVCCMLHNLAIMRQQELVVEPEDPREGPVHDDSITEDQDVDDNDNQESMQVSDAEARGQRRAVHRAPLMIARALRQQLIRERFNY
uniref:putative nuclease HARBI1 n=1 Tax=Pristiophorus japonicus TaxID=55135 RepID=UPI00398E9A59